MKTKKYYICVTPFFPSTDNWRGAYVYDQVKAIMRNSDYEVVVMKPTSWRDQTEAYTIDSVQVYLFPTVEMPSYFFNGLTNGTNGRSFLKRLCTLGISLEEISVIHTHTGPFACYGLAAKHCCPSIKVLVQHHDLDPFTIRNGKLAHWKPNARYRARKSIELFNEVDLHVCISTPVRDSLLAYPHARKEEIFPSYLECLKLQVGMPSIRPKDTYVLYNGVDLTLFHPQVHRQSSSDLFRIGCIGNFGDIKQQLVLIKAVERIIKGGAKDVRLSILGSGPTKQAHVDYVQEHGLAPYVEWPSEVTHDCLPDYYRSLDLFVLPSIYEGFGCVYLEAAACGVPFICVEHQGAAEYIPAEDASRWLMPANDDCRLAEMILAYRRERYPQRYLYSLDINELVRDFLSYLKQ